MGVYKKASYPEEQTVQVQKQLVGVAYEAAITNAVAERGKMGLQSSKAASKGKSWCMGCATGLPEADAGQLCLGRFCL